MIEHILVISTSPDGTYVHICDNFEDFLYKVHGVRSMKELRDEWGEFVAVPDDKTHYRRLAKGACYKNGETYYQFFNLASSKPILIKSKTVVKEYEFEE